MNTLPTTAVMVKAFRRKDAAFEGVFLVGIRTTGIFCRPTCRARPARESNMEFFATTAGAQRAGYRPCKLCRPTEPAREPELVRRLKVRVAAGGPRLSGRALRDMGIDPATARRQFQRHHQMSFAAFQRTQRVAAALREPRRNLISRQLAAGYASSSGFRAAREKFGAPGKAGVLHSRQLSTPLGPMIAVCDDAGICLCDFLDRKGLQGALERLRNRFSVQGMPAQVLPGEHRHLAALERQIAEYFAGTRAHFDLPLNPKGTPFQMSAWNYLKTVPFGETRTYAQQARTLGEPGAVRAVGRANGMNYLEILIPCHRVIASSGALSGYGGGLARKRWLLAHEAGVRE